MGKWIHLIFFHYFDKMAQCRIERQSVITGGQTKLIVFELKGDNKNYVQIFNSNFLKEAQLPLKAILFSNNLYISVA